jgi:hypothetical protein
LDAVAVVAVIGIIVLLPRDYWDNGPLIFGIGILTLVAFGSAVLVRKLPKRRDSTRMFGPRRVRFPFISLGCLIIAGSIAGAVALLSFDHMLPFYMLIPAGWGFFFIVYGLSIRNPETIEGALKSDARLPVLYLRAFKSENLAFVLTAVGSGRSARLESISFERHLGSAIRERIGPFVALGNPEDYLPHGGAVRTYAGDEGWYENFERLAGRAACIVMNVSDSNNLKRELTFIRREGLQRRLFIFTNTMKRKSAAYLIFESRLLAWTSSRLYGPRPADMPLLTDTSGSLATWEHFAENLGKLGFQLGNDPGRGAVVTFDSQGNGVVLVRGAEGFSKVEFENSWPPSNFVEPIRQYLVQTFGLNLDKVVVKAESPQVVALPSENVVPTPG